MEGLQDINLALLAPILILQLILVVFALINLSKQEETNGPKWMWVLIILFVNLIGAVLYFVIGRKK
ncbi:PLD nuclease N-terminal domain-containing protein [Bacillus alkalicellulosilyticus]|uniref:PLD nuclease N-terminal domain-containing protein n=1 Tax=Alkalihalobacterium alkalicellulosilyticum TaxID=1912214 RepID=UPI000998BD10|nr:PLD nuclease N-terminal domain-containing protein [Bacillus alkalicellulosilyticus]